MIRDYYNEVAGKQITTGLVLSHQTFGDFARSNPHHTDSCLKESLAQYIARAQISLEKLKYEPFHGKVLFKTPKYNDFFVDPLMCPKCGSEMKIIAIIMDPEETAKILRHLVKTGKSPPGFDPNSPN